MNLEDDVVGLHWVGSSEGRGARQQLKHQNSKWPGQEIWPIIPQFNCGFVAILVVDWSNWPVVCGDIMALIENHFWGDVLGRPAECPSLSAHLTKHQHQSNLWESSWTIELPAISWQNQSLQALRSHLHPKASSQALGPWKWKCWSKIRFATIHHQMVTACLI